MQKNLFFQLMATVVIMFMGSSCAMDPENVPPLVMPKERRGRTRPPLVGPLAVSVPRNYHDPAALMDLENALDAPVYIFMPVQNLEHDPLPTSPYYFLTVFVQRDNNVQTAHVLALYPRLIDAKYYNGNTLLHNAVAANKGWYVELLCQKGADMFAKNNAGETPMFIAESKAYSTMLPILHKYNLMR